MPISTLQRQAETCPDQVAFIAGRDEWTYRRLANASERVACAIRARGVQQGDRVVLHMANVPEMAIAYYACLRIGAIAAPLSIRLKISELRPLLQRLRPVLYLGQAGLYPLVAAMEPDILGLDARFVVGGTTEGSRVQPWESLMENAAEMPPLPTSDLGAPAVLLTTSGTTGQPKFVVHTRATLSATAGAFEHFGLDDRQVVLNTLPLAHVTGLSTLLACVRFGVPMILLERFDPDAVLDAVEAYRCSWLPGMPFMFANLLQQQQTRARDVRSLCCCLAAGDICPSNLQQVFEVAFGTPLRSIWGATEVIGALTYGLQPGPVSRISPGAQIRLVDDAGESVAQGDLGELQVRGSNVTTGYWAGPGEVGGLSENGWFRTGDLMRQGEGSDLWFVSRKKELIVRGGSNISPVEVEQVLMRHPAVRDAAVTGMPDPILGQRVAALVQLADDANGSSLNDIRASVSAQLADYKVPEQLRIVSTIPRNALGKIERASLAALVLSDCCPVTAPSTFKPS